MLIPAVGNFAQIGVLGAAVAAKARASATTV